MKTLLEYLVKQHIKHKDYDTLEGIVNTIFTICDNPDDLYNVIVEVVNESNTWNYVNKNTEVDVLYPVKPWYEFSKYSYPIISKDKSQLLYICVCNKHNVNVPASKNEWFYKVHGKDAVLTFIETFNLTLQKNMWTNV